MKFFRIWVFCILEVAPFAGVWIEIYSIPQAVVKSQVAPFAGVWIKLTYPLLSTGLYRRTLRGCVVEINRIEFDAPDALVTLRGCVD